MNSLLNIPHAKTITAERLTLRRSLASARRPFTGVR
jgi:hypothetical protein